MTDSFSATVTISNELGLHARAAAKLVNVANRFESKVEVSRDGQAADAKSIMGVLLLCGQRGAEITVGASGSDAEQAVRTIVELIQNKFGEDR